MINSWSLLYEELNGTMDKTYPIENIDMTEDINITTGIGSTGIYTVPDPDADGGINTAAGYTFSDEGVINIEGGNTVNLDYFNYTDSSDSLNFNVTGIGDDDLFASMDGVETLNLNIPTPSIEKQGCHKYEEDKSIKALQDYISTTYNSHYTSDKNDVQTLDLIESVGDAESFCRSNALKYLSRYDKKGQAKRDILKALHYTLLLYHFSGQLNETPTRGYETF